ncbi:MAG: hypothetical protein N2691_03170 [Patescibacteria group bacterium]|nr:hypothetical protein [Patescibacteria group bacterium]
MAVTYINGNTFTVDFVLWKRDISSYVRHAFFQLAPEIILRTRTVRFIHSLLFAVLVTGSVLFASELLGISNLLFLSIYFPVFLAFVVVTQYRRLYTAKSAMQGEQLIFCLEPGKMTFRRVGERHRTVLTAADIIAVVHKDDMIIITTRDDEYMLPTRALSVGQIESIKAFAG